MLVVEEPPEYSHQGIQNGDSAVERELGDLRCWQLPVCVSELGDATPLLGRVLLRQRAIVPRLLDGVCDLEAILEMNCFGEYHVVGLFRGIVGEDELSNVGLFAVAVLDTRWIADLKDR